MAPPNGHDYLSLEIILEEPEQHIPVVLEYLVRSGARVMEVSEIKSSLGDAIAFLAGGTR